MTEAYGVRVLDALEPDYATTVRNHDGTRVLTDPTDLTPRV